MSNPHETVERLMLSVLDDWFRTGSRGPCYLAYEPGGERLRVLAEDECLPDGYELVTGQRMPRNTNRDGCMAWMRPLCRRIPILKLEQD